MSFNRIKNKILRPPAAHNFVRLLDVDDEAKTTSNIARFALAIPPFNYVPAVKMCHDKVSVGLALATALKAVAGKGAPEGRQYNADLVRAFYAYDEVRGYSRCRYVESYSGQYRVARHISVPTAATFTIIENDKQTPVILCGWKGFGLTRTQVRVWMTMLESGLFSYADYRHSPAEVVLFPEVETRPNEPAERKPLVLRRGEIELFSEADMREIAAMFARAQASAMPIAESLWNERERKKVPPAPASVDEVHEGDNQPDLFATHNQREQN